MKVYIGPYVSWVGPYQIAEAILYPLKFFMTQEAWKDFSHKFGEFLNGGDKPSLLNKICNEIYKRKKRRVRVNLEDYDVWNFDRNMALIIHPALLKIKEKKMGSGYVDDEDVPEHLRSTAVDPPENSWDVDDNFFLRWDYVLNEMIWAFGEMTIDWEEKFYSLNDYTPNGPMRLHEKRIENGLRLFGKYYRSLWT